MNREDKIWTAYLFVAPLLILAAMGAVDYGLSTLGYNLF